MYYSDELCHYGVLGMRWGVRRARKNEGREERQKRKEAKRLEKKQFKKDFKEYERNKRAVDVVITNTGETITSSRGIQTLNRLKTEKGEQYANQIFKKSRNREIATLVGTTGASVIAAAGMAYLRNKYSV